MAIFDNDRLDLAPGTNLGHLDDQKRGNFLEFTGHPTAALNLRPVATLLQRGDLDPMERRSSFPPPS
jgi:hypothetical protein